MSTQVVITFSLMYWWPHVLRPLVYFWFVFRLVGINKRLSIIESKNWVIENFKPKKRRRTEADIAYEPDADELAMMAELDWYLIKMTCMSSFRTSLCFTVPRLD